MELSDIFDEIEPKCLYCLSLILNVKSESNFIEDSVDYSCDNCEEFFIDSFFKTSFNSGHYFSFSCKDLIVDINIVNERISISKIENIKIPFDTNFPIFTFDFSDKEKLYCKLKTYLSFS